MSSVVIFTESPGSGKTTICRALAAESPQGLHLVSDTYYKFIAHRLDPAQPESKHQNTVVMHALAPLTGPNPVPISPLLDIVSVTGPKKGG